MSRHPVLLPVLLFLLGLAAPALAQFHDDFTGPQIDPAWTWTDPGGDCTYQLGPLPGRLRMTVPPGNDHTTGHPPPLYAGSMLLIPVSGNFTITTHVSINYPGVPAAKESGLIIYQDTSNNLQFKRTNAYNSQNVLTYGNIANPTTAFFGQVNLTANDLFLRIVRSGSSFVSSYSLDGANWTQAGAVTWSPSGPLQAGISTSYYIWFGTNTGPALGDYDFFDLGVSGATMSANRAGVRAATGGTIGLSLDLGTSHAAQGYLVGGTISGATPGILLPGGATLPINFDLITSFMIQYAGLAGLFPGTIGALDSAGHAAASVIVPAGALTPLVGTSLRFAAVVALPGGLFGATNAAEVSIAP